MKNLFAVQLILSLLYCPVALSNSTTWNSFQQSITSVLQCEGDFCEGLLHYQECEQNCPQWADAHDSYYEIHNASTLGQATDLANENLKIAVDILGLPNQIDGCINHSLTYGELSYTTFTPHPISQAEEEVTSCSDEFNISGGAPARHTIDIEALNAAQWIEVVTFYNTTGTSEFEGTPHCSDEAKALMDKWFPVDGQADTYTTLFECLLIKVPVESTPSQSPIVEAKEDTNGNPILATHIQLDTPLLSDELDTFNQEWDINIGEGFFEYELCDDRAFDGDDGNPNGLCEFNLLAPNPVDAIDLNISEFDESWNIRVEGSLIAQEEDCPADKFIYLAGEEDSPYAHNHVAMPLIVDQDQDGYAHRPHLCTLVDQNLLQCDESTCSNDCPSEACMVCAIDCEATDWDPNDLDDSVIPNVGEECNGLDDDGDGQIDESLFRVWLDEDGDGFGDPNKVAECNESTRGRASLFDNDCNDEEALVYPGAPFYPIIETTVDAETGELSQHLVDTNCDGFSEWWRHNLMDWDHDGVKESLIYGEAFDTSLSDIVSHIQDVQNHLEIQNFKNPNWKAIENIYLESGFYPAAMVVDGFSLSIHSKPGAAYLEPVDPNCNGDCRSMLSVIGGGNVSIFGVIFAWGRGTSESIYQELTGELPWNDEAAPELPDWVDIDMPTPSESSDTVDFERGGSSVEGLAEARTEGGFRNGRSDEAGLTTPSPTPTEMGEDATDAATESGDYTWVNYCPAAEPVDDFRVGGAVLVHESQVIADQVTFYDNQAHGGSAIAVLGGHYDSMILNGYFRENHILEPGATYKGMINGALLVDNSKITVQGSYFWDNDIDETSDCYPTLGAAIGLMKSKALITNSQFEGNRGRYGSAITSLQSTRAGDSVEVMNNTFWKNHARVAAGAVLVLNTELSTLVPAEFTFKHNTVADNYSDALVGGIGIVGGLNQLSENLVARNFALGYGGLLMLSTGGQKLSNFTFDGNRSLLIDPTTPVMEGDLALLNGERALEILEDLDLDQKDELISMIHLFEAIQAGTFTVPSLTKSTPSSSERESGIQLPEENHHVSRTLFTSVYDIEYTRSCEGVAYDQMAYEALRISDYSYCSPQEDWLRLSNDPYLTEEAENFYLEHDYHLNPLSIYTDEDEKEPLPAGDFDDYGVYRGQDPNRQSGTYYSQCLPKKAAISMDLNLSPLATNHGALMDDDLPFLDAFDERRQDAFIFFLEPGESLYLKTESDTFTVKQRLYGPETFTFHVPWKGPLPAGCAGAESEQHFDEVVDYESRNGGYHLLVISAEEENGRGPYTVQSMY